MYAVHEIIKRKIPNVAPTRWIYNSRIVNTVFECKIELIEFLEQVTENSKKWDDDTISLASGFLLQLQDFKITFLLNTFHLIFSHTDILYNILQKRCFEINYWVNKIRELQNMLSEFRLQFDEIFEKSVSMVGNPRTNRIYSTQNAILSFYRRIYFEVIDTITQQINMRFEYLKCLEFIELLNEKSFQNYLNVFPDRPLNNLKNQYGKFFDFGRLQNELTVLYKSSEFKGKPIFELYR